MPYLVLAENEILTTEGRQLSFDHMLDYINRHETVIRFSQGKFASSNIQDIQPGLQCEDIPVAKITLASGEQFLTLGHSEILTSNNQWEEIRNLDAGAGIKTLTYNPYVRHPQLTPKIITSVELYRSAFSPVVSFNSLSDNILLSIQRDFTSTLIPIRPQKELSKPQVLVA